MAALTRAAALARIASNIAEHGNHVYRVNCDDSPSFLYTIGLTESAGFEVVLGGGAFFTHQQLGQIVDGVADQLKAGAGRKRRFLLMGLGAFSLRRASKSWVNLLLLGALDYYRDKSIVAYQVVPERRHHTADIPDMREPLRSRVNAAWRWFDKEWPFSVPQSSRAVTHLAVLRGQRVAEAARWEDDEWELFAENPEGVAREDVRVVPLGALLGLDPSLRAVTKLKVEEALRRDKKRGPWHPWRKRGP